MLTKRYNFLSFFGKDGEDLNFYYDESTNIWQGTIHIPEVSVNLYETVNVFIAEEFKNGLVTEWGYPHFSDPVYANSNNSTGIS